MKNIRPARITLEWGAKSPPAITCGVYGCMVHTRLFCSQVEARAQYLEMKAALDAIAAKLGSDSNLDEDALIELAGELCSDFVEHFP